MKTIAAIAILLSLSVAGCTTVTNRSGDRPIEKATVDKIVPGVTTRKAVIDTFGPPGEVVSAGDTEKLIYKYKETRTPTYFGGVIENKSMSRTSTSTLEITLKKGIVSSYRFSSAAEE
ncbi:MAG: hypothetical protein V3W31_07965 [Thermodesulfobacteriota bacterium]